MKIHKNKIFIAIFAIIWIIFSFQFYSIFKTYSKDTTSYVTLIKWVWTLRNEAKTNAVIFLKPQDKEEIKAWDLINITWPNSMAIIEWWDKSITRLAWNTRVKIQHNFIADDLSKINISFELQSWKTWSNVVTIMWDDSYFNEQVEWVVAAVRWTVFEVNKENDYIRTLDHEVAVTDWSWSTQTIWENNMMSISKFKIEDLKKLIDTSWEKINTTLDEDYIKNLREAFTKEFKNITYAKSLLNDENKILYMIKNWTSIENINKEVSTLSENTKNDVFEKIYNLNQNLNFENWEDSSLYNTKLTTRQLVIDNTTDTQTKQNMIKYSMYDLENLINSKVNTDLIKNSLNFLETNKSYIDFNNTEFSNFKNSLWNIINSLSNTSIDEVMNNLDSFSNKAANGLNNLINNLK